jgi:hypothetical protein
MNNVYFVFAQRAFQASKLNCEVAVEKTVERIRRDLADSQALDFAAQYAPVMEAGQMDTIMIALMQEAHKLDRLALGPALIEAVYDV